MKITVSEAEREDQSYRMSHHSDEGGVIPGNIQSGRKSIFGDFLFKTPCVCVSRKSLFERDLQRLKLPFYKDTLYKCNITCVIKVSDKLSH